MKKLLLFSLIAFAIGCSKYDDSAIQGDLNNLKDRVSKLEALCSTLNTNLASLTTIVDALQKQVTILQVEPLTNGYKIHFSDGNIVTIQNGKNSGDAPDIGVKQDTDGIYYWMHNGEWLTDEQDKKIQAQGTNGTTPQLKIENNYWYLSYDNGDTWTQLGKATGENGKDGEDGTDCIFKSVTEDTNNVYFQLTDDTQIIIPKSESSKFSIIFDNTDIAILNAGETKTVSYTITNATDATIVKTISQNGWQASVHPISTSAGTITLTAPNPITESEILVFANDGSYRTAMASLNCMQGQIIIADNSFNVDINGGIQDVHLLTNINYTIDIPDDAKSWISVIETRAMREETISFQIEKNEREPRFATIILRDDLKQPAQTIIFNQTSNKEIEIPDAAFKQYLLDNFDLNQDGRISHSEAQKITSINVYSDNIKSLKGIEYFTNLAYLTAVPKNDEWETTGVGGGHDTGNWRDSGYKLNGTRVSGKIAEIDLSHNINLSHLDCSGNIIKELDLSNNINLNYIDASFNLDLSVIAFPLKNRINALKLAATSIEAIDVSNMPDLQSLSINTGLGIHQIDLSNNLKLQHLNVQGNKLDNIDVSHNSMLETLHCAINNLQTLDVSNNPNLTTLNFAFNNIKSIDVSHNTALTELWFQNNNLSDIDVSMLQHLKFIHFGNYQKASDGSIICNNITHIDLSNNKQLISLFASLSDIPTIDISHNTALKRVFVEYNLLNTLDVSNSPILEELYCYANPNLTTVFISPEQTFTYSKDDWTKFQFIGGNANYYESTDYTTDGIVKVLQTATNGDGIDIVLMGDGYSDRLIANGTYDNTMQLAMEKFFSVEPYKSFRNMFNVYSVKAVSKNEEFALGTETAFSGYFGEGTHVQGNDQRVFEYAQKAISDERMNEALIVVMMNSTKYAGTCYMYYPTTGNYGNGASIAYFPVGTDEIELEQVLHHEAGGHGFSKLADEYAYEEMHGIPPYMIDQYKQQEPYGWWKNADFTNDPTTVKWAHFLSDPRYANDDLGVFEGAFTYWTGAYRPTENSIMRYNTGGFNAPSREAIYYRMNKLAYGEAWIYDYERFVEYDAINRKTSTSAYIPYRLPENIEPLHAPVVIKNSWRNAKNNAPTQYKSNGTTNTNVAGNRLHKASSLPQTTGIPRTLIVTGNNPTEGYMESGARIK
ncbi:PL29 family lyase N-terminal domain-containing protein [Alistipes indistinctus]|uniref:PL29 family lyase N-terminal domain-containing protein n=1 Tax=Alistipes indistinctus TaxID=626932 RepID=UPI0024B969EC|nr:PL29 family lyase N-terminal domain-containing protein [Alistipes indistinctus]